MKVRKWNANARDCGITFQAMKEYIKTSTDMYGRWTRVCISGVYYSKSRFQCSRCNSSLEGFGCDINDCSSCSFWSRTRSGRNYYGSQKICISLKNIKQTGYKWPELFSNRKTFSNWCIDKIHEISFFVYSESATRQQVVFLGFILTYNRYVQVCSLRGVHYTPSSHAIKN